MYELRKWSSEKIKHRAVVFIAWTLFCLFHSYFCQLNWGVFDIRQNSTILRIHDFG